jgi:hypothetical protein
MNQRRLRIPGDVDMAPAIYTNSWHCAYQTVRTEGVRALYKGLVPNWLRLGPFAIIVSFSSRLNSKMNLCHSFVAFPWRFFASSSSHMSSWRRWTSIGRLHGHNPRRLRRSFASELLHSVCAKRRLQPSFIVIPAFECVPFGALLALHHPFIKTLPFFNSPPSILLLVPSECRSS